jgi:hypothetical protein
MVIWCAAAALIITYPQEAPRESEAENNRNGTMAWISLVNGYDGCDFMVVVVFGCVGVKSSAGMATACPCLFVFD